MKKFKTAVAMRCNEQQFEEVREQLEKMGYKIFKTFFDEHKYLVNNLGGENGALSSVQDYEKSAHSRLVLEQWNADLFLALAAMVEGDVISEGEWFYNDKENVFKPYGECCYGEIADGKNFHAKATAEQLIGYFAKQVELPKLSEVAEPEIGKRYLTDDGKVVDVVRGEGCGSCCYFNTGVFGDCEDIDALCDGSLRTDGKSVQFKLIETKPEPNTITFASEKEMAKFLIDGDLWQNGYRFYSEFKEGALRFYIQNHNGTIVEMQSTLKNAYNKTFYLSEPKPSINLSIDELKQIAAEAKGVDVEQIKVQS
jgi:hypothetical protein